MRIKMRFGIDTTGRYIQMGLMRKGGVGVGKGS